NGPPQPARDLMNAQVLLTQPADHGKLAATAVLAHRLLPPTRVGPNQPGGTPTSRGRTTPFPPVLHFILGYLPIRRLPAPPSASGHLPRHSARAWPERLAQDHVTAAAAPAVGPKVLGTLSRRSVAAQVALVRAGRRPPAGYWRGPIPATRTADPPAGRRRTGAGTSAGPCAAAPSGGYGAAAPNPATAVAPRRRPAPAARVPRHRTRPAASLPRCPRGRSPAMPRTPPSRNAPAPRRTRTTCAPPDGAASRTRAWSSPATPATPRPVACPA